MARLLSDKVEVALQASRSTEETACPEAVRWIETVRPLAELFG
jgi:hypothetical protein